MTSKLIRETNLQAFQENSQILKDGNTQFMKLNYAYLQNGIVKRKIARTDPSTSGKTTNIKTEIFLKKGQNSYR